MTTTAPEHSRSVKQNPLAWWPWVRRLRDVNGASKRLWFWTPITYRFGHGGWVYLSAAWLWRFRKGPHR